MSSDTVRPMELPLENENISNLYGTYPRRTWATQPSPGPRCHFHAVQHDNQTAATHKPHNNGEVKGILRNKYEYSTVSSPVGSTAKFDDDVMYDAEPDSPTVSSNFAVVMNRFVRPCLSEFVGVVFCVLVSTLVYASIPNPSASELVIVAGIDALSYMVSIGTLTSSWLHMNPAVTLGQLFAGGCSPLLCVAFWISQTAAATTAVFLFQVVSMEVAVVPVLTSAPWLSGVYRLVLCQMVTSFMLVLSHLMVFTDKCPPAGNPPPNGILSVSSAVGIVSFVSLLNSGCSWNPATSLGTSIALSMQGIHVPSWKYHYVFWMGPLIGSLFASFLYRLLFATGEHRLSTCQQQSTV